MKQVETDEMKAHKLHQVLKALDLPHDALDGKRPPEIASIVKSRVGKRTEYEHMNDSVIVTLAGKEYEIKLRPMDQDFEWRKRLGELASKFVDRFTSAEDANIAAIVKQALPMIFSEGLNDVVDLMFLYAPELPRAEIMQTAKTHEVIEAAMRVFEFAIPLFTVVLRNLMKFAGTMK